MSDSTRAGDGEIRHVVAAVDGPRDPLTERADTLGCARRTAGLDRLVEREPTETTGSALAAGSGGSPREDRFHHRQLLTTILHRY
jgi:hypothetical protein